MEFQEFISEIEVYGFGVVAFNTYQLNEENHCYIMVSEKGDSGRFYKSECAVRNLNRTLSHMYGMVIALTRPML